MSGCQAIQKKAMPGLRSLWQTDVLCPLIDGVQDVMCHVRDGARSGREAAAATAKAAVKKAIAFRC